MASQTKVGPGMALGTHSTSCYFRGMTPEEPGPASEWCCLGHLKLLASLYIFHHLTLEIRPASGIHEWLISLTSKVIHSGRPSCPHLCMPLRVAERIMPP